MGVAVVTGAGSGLGRSIAGAAGPRRLAGRAGGQARDFTAGPGLASARSRSMPAVRSSRPGLPAVMPNWKVQ